MQDHVSPEQILQIGFGFWPSKTLLSAVELGVFTVLANGPMTGAQLQDALELHPRATSDFLDTLVSIGLLNRDGPSASGRYSNTPSTAAFLDRKSPTYIGGLFEMANARLYPFWADLTAALKTGKPQNEVKNGNPALFDTLYSDPARLEQFMDAMSGVSMGNFAAFADKFDFSTYKTMADIGGATGQLASFVARRHPHMSCASYDLAAVQPIAERRIKERGLEGRVKAGVLDFLKQDLPNVDVITTSNILHDWDLATKKMLIAKAYRALPQGGAFVAIENVIDDERRRNAFGLMMSLNMLIETGSGFDYTGAQFNEWCKEAGFKRTEVIHLAGPASAALAYK
jgi:O-methyltransferase domain/Dimerisation domain